MERSVSKRDNKLARPGDAAKAAALRKLEKPPHRVEDLIVDIGRRARAFGFSVFENGVTGGQRVLRMRRPSRPTMSFAKRRGAPFSESASAAASSIRTLVLLRL
jgi:hypothetical protein